MSEKAKYHFSHLPVWVDGNAYFNGAKACVNEKNALVDGEHSVTVELVEKDGTFCLKTNLYQYLQDFENSMINSDILGFAFEPEQRFENPDGTGITFDRDYLGEHRGLHPIPGPFATAKPFVAVL